jgi:hypothetical protein
LVLQQLSFFPSLAPNPSPSRNCRHNSRGKRRKINIDSNQLTHTFKYLTNIRKEIRIIPRSVPFKC